jgi:hypothetical protein
VIAFLALIPGRAWLYAAGIVAVLALATYTVHHFESVGAADATAKIERSNNASEDRADRAQAPIDDCLRAGGHWDRDKWLCVNPSSGK